MSNLENRKILLGVTGGSGGFESDVNQLEVFWRGGGHDIEQASKQDVAKQLIDLIGERYTGALTDNSVTAGRAM